MNSRINAQQEFTVTQPFIYDQHASTASGQFVVSFNHADLYAQLRARYVDHDRVQITQIPLPGNQLVDLRLQPVYVFPLGGSVRVIEAGGPRDFEPEVSTFSGFVATSPAARAFLSVTAGSAGGAITLHGFDYHLSGYPQPEFDLGRLAITQSPSVPRGSAALAAGGATRCARNEFRVADVWAEAAPNFTQHYGFRNPDVAFEKAIEFLTHASEELKFQNGVALNIPCPSPAECFLKVWISETPPFRPPWLQFWSAETNGFDLGGLSEFFRDYDTPPYPPRALAHFFFWRPGADYFGAAWINSSACSDVGAYSYTRAGSDDDFREVTHHEIEHLFGWPGVGSNESMRPIVLTAPCLDVEHVVAGDWNDSGNVDGTEAGLAESCWSAYTQAIRNPHGSVADGCADVFDMNQDGRITWCDVVAAKAIAGEPLTTGDCNNNGIDDCAEIAQGIPDCDGNGVLDACDLLQPVNDCNTNGIVDWCESRDYNRNGQPDVCDIASGHSPDCNANGIPDDSLIYDLLTPLEKDCQPNNIPDDCEPNDCNGDDIPDSCQSEDCNANGTWDICEIAAGTSLDCNSNQRPDECDPSYPDTDCNDNQITDLCDIGSGFSKDLNENSRPDECDVHHTFYVDDNTCPNSGSGSQLDPFCAIKTALDAANSNNAVYEIVVEDGDYRDYDNRNLAFGAKALTLRSRNGPASCTIDTQGSEAEPFVAFTFDAGNGPGVVLDGFTITNSYQPAGQANGVALNFDAGSRPLVRNCNIINMRNIIWGAIRCNWNSAPRIENCLISGNTGIVGAGILCQGCADLVISNSTISGNVAELHGAGLTIHQDRVAGVIYPGHVIIDNCLIADNAAVGSGAALFTRQGDLTIRNSTIAGNDASIAAGAIVGAATRLTIMNSILANNTALRSPEIMLTEGSTAASSASIVQGGSADIGCPNSISWNALDTDPTFVNPENGDYRLAPGSPGIDAGDNSAVPPGVTTDLSGGPRFLDDCFTPDTGVGAAPVVDIGPHEFDRDIAPLQPAADSTPKTRFLSFSNPNPGPSAIMVQLMNLQDPQPPNAPCCPPPNFSAYEYANCPAAGPNSCPRWVGPPFTYLESRDSPGLGSYKAARLQCTPYDHDWSNEGLVHVTGAEIIPSSTYELRVRSDACGDSAPLTLTTARGGDVFAPFNPPSTSPQPEGPDVAAVVNKYKNLPGAIAKSIAQVNSNAPILNNDVDGSDISVVVDAVKGFAYGFSGPCPCPVT